MRFKLLTLSAMLFLALANYMVLPPILQGLRSNPKIQKYLTDPDLAFQFFSQCKERVADADACYQAYSAAVELANSKNCSLEGVALKRRFKQLVEHSNPGAIESEIIEECLPSKAEHSSR